MNTERFSELCYLYFFRALDENEELEFIFHFVSDKSSCRVIFSEVKELALCLAAVVDMAEPPASLKEDLLQKIRAMQDQEMVVI